MVVLVSVVTLAVLLTACGLIYAVELRGRRIQESTRLATLRRLEQVVQMDLKRQAGRGYSNNNPAA